MVVRVSKKNSDKRKRTLFRLVTRVLFTLVAASAICVLTDTDLRALTTAYVEEAVHDCEASGFHLRRFFDDDGFHRYVVFNPRSVPTAGRQRPLIVFLNGLGENGGDGIAPMRNGLVQRIHELAGTFPFVALILQCHQHERQWSVDGPAVRRGLAIIRQTQKEYQTDLDRTCLTGISSGGNGVWNMAATDPELFAAIAPIASMSVQQQTIAEHRIPIFTWINRADIETMASYQETTHRQLTSGGAASRFVDVGEDDEESGAHDAWDFAFGSGQLFSWLLRQSRSSRRDDRQCASPPVNRPNDEHHGRIRTLGTLSSDCELEFEFRPGSKSAVEFAAWPPGESESRWVMHVGRPDDGYTLLRIGADSIQAGSAVAGMSIREHEWNHLRIRRQAEQLKVFVNDWELFSTDIAAGDWTLAANVQPVDSSDPVDITDIRGHGIAFDVSAQEQNNIPFDSFSGPNTKCETSTEQIASAWLQRQGKTAGLVVKASLDRSGNGRWCRFQAAAPHSTPRLYQTIFEQDRTTVRRRWNYPGTAFRHARFERGLSRQEHLSWMSAFSDGRDKVVASRTNLLVFTDSRRTETLLSQRTNEPNHQLITNSSTAVPGNDDPEELFARVPQLIWQPSTKYGFGIELSQFRLQPEAAWANGRWCRELQHQLQSESGMEVTRVFVDPENSFAITKYVRQADDGCRDVITIDYSQDGTPTAWSIASQRPRDPRAETTYPAVDAVVHFGSAEIEDIKHDAETMNPSGNHETIICDRTTGHSVWTLQSRDGSDRQLSPGEVHQRLVPRALQSRWNPLRLPNNLNVGLAAGLFVSGMVLIRRLRQSFTDHQQIELNSRHDGGAA